MSVSRSEEPVMTAGESTSSSAVVSDDCARTGAAVCSEGFKRKDDTAVLVNGMAELELSSEGSETSVTVRECSPANSLNDKQLAVRRSIDVGLDTLVREDNSVQYFRYCDERQLPAIISLMSKDLSEPYSIYTYRYFITQWPKLTFLAQCNGCYVGAIVCKVDAHKHGIRRGYIAMLAVDVNYRHRKIGTSLVRLALQAMAKEDCDEIALETEVTNKAALALYERLGFSRDKRLFRYYLNDVDALRLKLWLT